MIYFTAPQKNEHCCIRRHLLTWLAKILVWMRWFHEFFFYSFFENFAFSKSRRNFFHYDSRNLCFQAEMLVRKDPKQTTFSSILFRITQPTNVKIWKARNYEIRLRLDQEQDRETNQIFQSFRLIKEFLVLYNPNISGF